MFGQAFKRIRNIWRSWDYRVQEIGWKYPMYFSPLIDSLAEEGISLADLNKYLDEHDFPMEIGRFPRMLSKREDLAGVLVREFDSLKARGVHERERLIDSLAKKMADAYFS